jgi:DNA-binding transcriptional MerR regulator
MSGPALTEKYSLTLVRVITASPATYSLEVAARLADVHPEMLRYYCRLGLFGEARARPGAELIFDDDALYELRRFEHYRRHHGLNRKTLRLICGLWREIERLQAEVRFLRGP